MKKKKKSKQNLIVENQLASLKEEIDALELKLVKSREIK